MADRHAAGRFGVAVGGVVAGADRDLGPDHDLVVQTSHRRVTPRYSLRRGALFGNIRTMRLFCFGHGADLLCRVCRNCQAAGIDRARTLRYVLTSACVMHRLGEESMKSFWRLLVVIALLTGLMVSGVVSAQEDMGYEETAVTLDNEIAAIVGQPQVDGPVPAVVMLHGFASVKDEVGEMYKRLAAALGERGIASIRIDFRGWGESGGGMENSTVTGMVEDAAVAYEYMASQDFVDASQMGVLGFSLGGRIAIVTAGQNPDWYASMGLWSTGGNIDPVTFQGEEAYDTAQAEGQVTLDLGWTMITLGSEFFDSLTAYDVEEEYPKYSGPVFVVAGTDDPDPAEYFDWYLENAQGELRAGLLVEGGDHIYAVLTDDQTMAEKVIATTADWFAMTLGE